MKLASTLPRGQGKPACKPGPNTATGSPKRFKFDGLDPAKTPVLPQGLEHSDEFFVSPCTRPRRQR